MKTLKYIKQTIILGIVVLSFGCEKMLSLYPEDKLTRDDYWRVGDDVEVVTIGAYNKLQECASTFFVWGELRGELVWANHDPDHVRVPVDENQLTQDNPYCNWGCVYKTINMFNTVIDCSAKVVEMDETFSEDDRLRYVGEAKTMRALCYFYLARTFETLPYITVASLNDEQNYVYPGLPGSQVLDSLVKDLQWAEKVVRKNFDDMEFTTAKVKLMYEKGRVTQPVVWALLADIFLTKNDYANALVYLDKVIGDPRYKLVEGSKWLDIFYPGNSSEGIFELQFSHDYENSGEMLKWFGNSLNGGELWYYLQKKLTTNTYTYWEGDDRMKPKTDIRGEGNTYPSRFNTAGLTWSGYGAPVWKWVGKKTNGVTINDLRDGTSNDPNWIFYRLSDIYLMKAEVLNRLNRSTEAANILHQIRERAGIIDPVAFSSVNDLEGQILDERAAELAAEGKRWFDLVRIAKRQNDFDVLVKRIVEVKYAQYYQQAARARLTEPLSWYFPIYRSELDKNPYLKQNKYYSVGK